jgi:hypothetical protein
MARRNRLPHMRGEPIRIRFSADLKTSFHAASFLRRREIVLDAALLHTPSEFARILAHEVFHFVWLRLGNAVRTSYERLLTGELARRARGELGWSAEWRKDALSDSDVKQRTRRWREYVCESFCDTAAWIYTQSRHPELTLAGSHRQRRRAWFQRNLKPPLSI